MELGVVRQYALSGIVERYPIKAKDVACYVCKKGRTNPRIQVLCRLMDRYSQRFEFEYVCLECLQRCYKSDVTELRKTFRQEKIGNKFRVLFDWADSHRQECQNIPAFVNLLKTRDEGKEPHPYILKQCWVEKDKITRKAIRFID